MIGLQDVADIQVTSVPSPLDRNQQINMIVDRTIVEKVGSIRWTHKITAMYYNILGYPPPFNNVGFHEKGSPLIDRSRGILDTHAVFQGIKRPHIEKDVDKSVYIYIIMPEYCYEYIPNMVCGAKRKPFPEGTVFAIYVNFDEGNNTGEIFNWEYVKADPDDQTLPDNFANRYDKRRW